MNRELAALVFELQRARSPIDRARALARAWRTLRGLSPTERRLLVREVGFEGAEDLVEGLVEKGGGAFSPAAVLEALGQMRRDEGVSLKGILADLRDPRKRDELLLRGIDLATTSVSATGLDDEGGASSESVQEVATDHVAVTVDEPEPESEELRSAVPEADAAPAPEAERSPALPVERPPIRARPPTKERPPEPASDAEEPSPWDEIWRASETTAPAETRDVGSAAEGAPDSRIDAETGDRSRARTSVIGRLRAFRAAIPGLRAASPAAVADALAELPEPWARRRALSALVAAGVPSSAAEALDLIEGLERPMDRRWCLAELARRGDLSGHELDRALALLVSPAARRRLYRLAVD